MCKSFLVVFYFFFFPSLTRFSLLALSLNSEHFCFGFKAGLDHLVDHGWNGIKSYYETSEVTAIMMIMGTDDCIMRER